MKKITILFITILTIMSLSSTVYANSTGIIKGRVSKNGSPVAGAEVVLITENMQTFISKTNKNGYYSFNNLTFGRYLITVKINDDFYINYKIKN